MANLTSVHVTDGIPDTGTGDVSTLDAVLAVLPAALAANGGLKVEGVASGTVIPVSDGGGSITVDGSVTASGTVTANLGTIGAAATAAKQPALGTAGTASTDVITIQGIASGTVVPISDGGGSVTVDGTVAVSALSGTSAVKGGTASGASIANAPVTTGGRAATALPTAVTDGQVVDALMSKYGHMITKLSLRENLSHQFTTITASVSETTIITADASNKLDLIGLLIANTSATPVHVTIKDSTAGTTRTDIQCPAGVTSGFMTSGRPMVQIAAVNNNWTATSSASVSSLLITAIFEKGGA